MTTEMDGTATEALLRTRRYFSDKVSSDLRTLDLVGGREADAFYRDRWSHDKVVRSTHGVNCTGSCSWKVYVKDGIITWEAQQTDYPAMGADRPGYEPRGCPRGAAFSWYTYSPTRIRYPYVRGTLLELYREAKGRLGDPVDAWADVVTDPERAATYKRSRGKGGLVRATWGEVLEMIAAAHVHTIETEGPDRIAAFSPIPAMSLVSFAAGSRWTALLGGSQISFYDWYADLPVASPQFFGDQTDVPESADWWDSSYLMMWGTNVPVTRTPDAHFMTEARYRGQKVVVVSPDYADNTKFADEWMAPHPGTDGALAMAMGHVILQEFYVDQQVERFQDYVRSYTDLPFLVTLTEREDAHVPGKFLTAADLGDTGEGAQTKTVLLDADGQPFVPNGSLGFRFTDSGKGRWNLDLGDVTPLLTLHGAGAETAAVDLPRFDSADGTGSVIRRGVPVRRIGGRLVTTVLDLMLAQYGVGRPGLPGSWPTGYDDPDHPGTPAWQEAITSVPAAQCVRVAREFARNADESQGRSMILMGAGTNHWFHSDMTYRTFLTLTTITGCQGVNGGGWAHYVGQEKIRPISGSNQVAGALDWQRPPRHMQGTIFYYLHTSQWRYDGFQADALASPLATGAFTGQHTADLVAQATRMGWMPSSPTFDRNPLDLADEAGKAGLAPSEHVVNELRAGRLHFACEDPDAPQNSPKILTLWRSNLLGSSSKGTEYFVKHLLGTDSSLRAEETPEDKRPQEVRWRPDGATGKLDLLLTLDFRMTSSTLFSDVVLPAATWYEKHDLSSTDMHPFVHAFTPAIDPPWQTRTDWDAFTSLAKVFSEMAATRLGVRKDILAGPLMHDSPDEMSTPHGVVRDWKKGDCEPVPGQTMPKITEIERDYGLIWQKMTSLGPLSEQLGMTTKGTHYDVTEQVELLRHTNGIVRGGVGHGQPSLARDTDMCEAILAMSGATNGDLAAQGFRTLEQRVGRPLADLADDHAGDRITFADTQAQPMTTFTTPEWSGSHHGGRQYSPFTINTERLKPWHTLTGRMQFFLEHDWMHELGEALPVFRPPLNMHLLFGEPQLGDGGQRELTVRYLTPHNKWSIHSEYQDNLLMLSLSRGGPLLWMSSVDAAAIGIEDNDWVEMVNRNGIVVARAVVSTRMPAGTVFMHHAQDRVIDVPRTETDGKRGGNHNSATRVMVKPTHLIGGHAQQSYDWNYIGPTGNQRDEVTVIRRRSQEVSY